MKRVKEQGLELQPGQWWVEQSKDAPTKLPSSKQRRPLLNNNSSRKLKQEPHTNKVSTHLSAHSPHVWTLADTPLNNNLGLGPSMRRPVDVKAHFFFLLSFSLFPFS